MQARYGAMIAALWCATVAHAAPPAGFGTPDQMFVVSVVDGTMRFDKEFLVAKPGAKIKLVFKNTDLMPHNLVICSPGDKVTQEVAAAAIKMGAAGLKAGFIPKDKRVLFATKLLQPGENQDAYFKAPAEKADYPYVCTFPGHSFTMKGILRVSDDLNQKPPTTAEFTGKGVKIESEPVVHRTYIKGIATSAICVGSPTGLHYAFNPDTCTLASVWTGDFVDANGDFNRRGGGGSKVIGKVAYKAGAGFPLRIGSSSQAPKVVYRGYRLKGGYPTFLYDVDGVRVQHGIAPEPGGKRLSQWFDLDTKGKTVYYIADKNAADKISSHGGKFEKGKLRVSGKERVRFEVGVTP